MPLENGIASPPTACRLLAGIDEWMFLYAFMEWVGEIIPTRGRHIAIDGKALRGSVEKVKGNKASMVLNALDAETGLVLAQIPIQEKTNEITAIPEILKLFSLRGSTITTDSIGTQTEIMLQIREQGGHFILLVKGNQPQTYEEILKFMGEARDDYAAQKKEADTAPGPRYPEIMESYGEWSGSENNRDRKEYRHCCITNEKGIVTRTETEWPWIETVGLLRQIRIPMERDENGEDITPDVETFLKEGSRRKPKPQKGDNEKSDIQEVGLISDLKLGAEKIAMIKRTHWSVENKLHHALDDTFREDRSPAKKCRNNLALIRKFAYNILRLAQNAKEGAEVMTEMMDSFCDNPSLMQKYVFQGIKSHY